MSLIIFTGENHIVRVFTVVQLQKLSSRFNDAAYYRGRTSHCHGYTGWLAGSQLITTFPRPSSSRPSSPNMPAITSSRRDTSKQTRPRCRYTFPSPPPPPGPANILHHNPNLPAEQHQPDNLSPEERRLHRHQEGIARIVGFLTDASHNGPNSPAIPERLGFSTRLFTSLRKHVESFGFETRRRFVSHPLSSPKSHLGPADSDPRRQYNGADPPTINANCSLGLAHEIMAKLPSRIMQLLDTDFYGPEWRGNPIYSIRSCGSSR